MQNGTLILCPIERLTPAQKEEGIRIGAYLLWEAHEKAIRDNDWKEATRILVEREKRLYPSEQQKADVAIGLYQERVRRNLACVVGESYRLLKRKALLSGHRRYEPTQEEILIYAPEVLKMQDMERQKSFWRQARDQAYETGKVWQRMQDPC